MIIANGRQWTWWLDYSYTFYQPVPPELPPIDPPPRLIEDYPPFTLGSWPDLPPMTHPAFGSSSSTSSPTTGSRHDSSPVVHSTPYSSSSTPLFSNDRTSRENWGTSPLPAPETDDPLYRVIGNLLSSRPTPAQTTPVVVQGRPTNPWPIALVGLVAVGAVAYVMTRRGK